MVNLFLLRDNFYGDTGNEMIDHEAQSSHLSKLNYITKISYIHKKTIKEILGHAKKTFRDPSTS